MPRFSLQRANEKKFLHKAPAAGSTLEVQAGLQLPPPPPSSGGHVQYWNLDPKFGDHIRITNSLGACIFIVARE